MSSGQAVNVNACKDVNSLYCANIACTCIFVLYSHGKTAVLFVKF